MNTQQKAESGKRQTEAGSLKSEAGRRTRAALWLTLLCLGVAAPAADLASLCADREAIERIYYSHRLGVKPPFEQAVPSNQIAALVRLELKKEAVLKRVYGVEITPALEEAEVQRINATTRAPEVLAELKAALGRDAGRFARTVARPIVVEQTLRARFENDDGLHAPQRQETERLRERLLTAKSNKAGVAELGRLLQLSSSNACPEVAWLLTPRSKAESAAARQPQPALPAAPTTVKASAGPYSIQATVQLAQVIEPRQPRKETFYFEDLPGELQRVLKAQLRQPGDVSAVIELPHQFQLYVAKAVTTNQMTVLSRTVPKRSFDQWLENQP